MLPIFFKVQTISKLSEWTKIYVTSSLATKEVDPLSSKSLKFVKTTLAPYPFIHHPTPQLYAALHDQHLVYLPLTITSFSATNLNSLELLHIAAALAFIWAYQWPPTCNRADVHTSHLYFNLRNPSPIQSVTHTSSIGREKRQLQQHKVWNIRL